uniref:Uncharacterized protein n=1 Tax=Oryza brachyantha TaxID=4533 RepID=J3L0S8_ORYBR
MDPSRGSPALRAWAALAPVGWPRTVASIGTVGGTSSVAVDADRVALLLTGAAAEVGAGVHRPEASGAGWVDVARLPRIMRKAASSGASKEEGLETSGISASGSKANLFAAGSSGEVLAAFLSSEMNAITANNRRMVLVRLRLNGEKVADEVEVWGNAEKSLTNIDEYRDLHGGVGIQTLEEGRHREPETLQKERIKNNYLSNSLGAMISQQLLPWDQPGGRHRGKILVGARRGVLEGERQCLSQIHWVRHEWGLLWDEGMSTSLRKLPTANSGALSCGFRRWGIAGVILDFHLYELFLMTPDEFGNETSATGKVIFSDFGGCKEHPHPSLYATWAAVLVQIAP